MAFFLILFLSIIAADNVNIESTKIPVVKEKSQNKVNSVDLKKPIIIEPKTEPQKTESIKEVVKSKPLKQGPAQETVNSEPTPVLDEIAVNTHNKHIDTQVPCNVQVIKNLVKEGLIDRNLLSSPSFLILKKRKLPSRIAQTTTQATTTRLSIGFTAELYRVKRTTDK